jgi:hypothetical protein
MRSAFFLLLRLICYPALAVMIAAGAALGIVWVNGQCPPFDEAGVTCATRFSQALADFGIAVALFSAITGIPVIPALGGAAFLVFDLHRKRKPSSSRS